MNKKKIMTLVMATSLLATTLLSGCGVKSADNSKDKDYVVKLGYYNCDHMTSASIAKDTGIFDKLGLKVEVTGNGKVPEAMAAGQMDVGYIGTGGLIGAKLKGSPITIIANNHSGGSYYLVASNDIQTPQDLVGKRLAIGSKPENSSTWLDISKKLGIPAEGSNYAAVNMGEIKDKYIALKTGKIDGYTTCDPWGSMAEYEKTGKIMATYPEDPNYDGVCCVLAMNTNFVKEHPELAKKMIVAHTQAMQYIYTHPLKSAKIFAENYNVPEEVALMTIYKKTVGEGRTLTWDLSKESLKNEIASLQNSKEIEGEPNIDELYQDKLYKEAGVDDFDKFIKEKVDPVFPEGMAYDEWKQKALEIDK